MARPYHTGLYADRIGGFLDDLAELEGVDANLDLTGAREAVAEWERLGGELAEQAHSALRDGADPEVLERRNEIMIGLERALLLPDPNAPDGSPGEGIPDRPWFRHGLYAPRYTYAAMTLPGVTEAVEDGDWERARAELDRIERSLRAAVGVLEEALAVATE